MDYVSYDIICILRDWDHNNIQSKGEETDILKNKTKQKYSTLVKDICSLAQVSKEIVSSAKWYKEHLKLIWGVYVFLDMYMFINHFYSIMKTKWIITKKPKTKSDPSI